MRSRQYKNEIDDPYGYEVNSYASDYHAMSYSATAPDGLIHIPDDGATEDQIDLDRVNMGTIIAPSGAASSLVDPVLNCGDVRPTKTYQRQLRKRSRPNNIDTDDLDSGNTSPYQIVNNSSIASPNMLINDQRPVDDDYHFLMSLHPYMTDLNPTQKLRLRMKIQKLVYKELYNVDVDEK